jgi:hypothetical protein
MVMRRKLSQNPDINMLMTTTLNSALYHKYRDGICKYIAYRIDSEDADHL